MKQGLVMKKKQWGDWVTTQNEKSIGKTDWVILGVLFSFALFTILYIDIVTTYTHSLTLLDAVSEFDIVHFYDRTLAKPYDSVGAMYYITIYMIFAVWNLPVWILTKITSISVYAPGCLIWCKLLVVVFAAGCAYMIYDILIQMEYEHEKCIMAVFLFLSSLNFFVPVVAVSQYDIISLFFMLWGIRELLLYEKITWKFLVLFSFAISLKFFALFVFLPVVLLKEKRIFWIIKDYVAGLIVTVMCVIPFRNNAGYQELAGNFNNGITTRLFEHAIQGGNASCPIFIGIFMALCVLAYVKDGKEKRKLFQYSMWICYAVFLMFTIFVYVNPYWIVLLVPFQVLLWIQNNYEKKINMILDFGVNVAITGLYAYQYFWVYFSGDTFRFLTLKKLFENSSQKYHNLKELLDTGSTYGLTPILFAAFVVCGISLLVINYPDRVNNIEKMEKSNISAIDHGMIYLRLLCILGYIVLTAVFAFGI